MLRVLAICLVLATLTAADNLLRNGELTTLDAAGAPLHWKTSEGVAISVEPAAGKEPAVLRIDIGKPSGEGMGSLAQRVAVPAGVAKLVLSGRVRASADGLGVLQAKLLAGGKEASRLNSPACTTAWQDLRVEIPCAGIEEVAVQCRFSLAARAAGQQVWFGQLRLEAAAP